MKKSRILYLAKYLLEESDEKNPVTINDIVENLNKQGIKVGRRTVPDDIKELLEIGMDIVVVKSTQNKYFVGTRDFELPEIKLLIDAVCSSQLITPKKSAILVDKIKRYLSKFQCEEFANDILIEDFIKPTNEKIYISIDKIQSAIYDRNQIEFRYFDYLPNKEKVLKNNGEKYIISPYGLSWVEDKYYLIGYSEKREKVVTFRVDRIADLKATSQDVKTEPEGFNVLKYRKTMFEMFDGNKAVVKLKCKNYLMKVIIDKFGEDVYTEIIDKEHFVAVADINISNMFYGWVVQFAGDIQIVSPDDIIAGYKELIKKSMQKR